MENKTSSPLTAITPKKRGRPRKSDTITPGNVKQLPNKPSKSPNKTRKQKKNAKVATKQIESVKTDCSASHVQEKKKTGRKPKYQDPKLLQDKIQEYFDQANANPINIDKFQALPLYDWLELALHLGFNSAKHLMEYAEGAHGAALSQPITRARGLVMANTRKWMMVKNNPKGPQCILQNMDPEFLVKPDVEVGDISISFAAPWLVDKPGNKSEK